MKKLIAAPPSTLPCSAVIDCHRNLFSLWLTTGRKLGRSGLLHSFTISSKPCCVEAKQRRSANYHPSIWDPKVIESLTTPYSYEFHGTKLKELKKEVTSLLAFAPDPWATWKLIDLMQRLGVAYHFGKEIDEALNNVLKETVIGDLYTTSLLFRILREHAFPISTDVFNKFRGRDGKFVDSLRGDMAGLLSLYEASHLGMHGEDVMDEAQKFSAEHLKSSLGKIGSNLAFQVQQSLQVPLHWKMPRIEARTFIDVYQKDDSKNSILIELAKLDFNLVQAVHQQELKELATWWRDLGFKEKMSFSRDRLMENYIWAMRIIFEPQFSKCRIYLTRFVCILTAIDDMYDVYGMLDELELFTRAVNQWDIGAMKDLPEYMKPCYLALFNFVNELGHDILIDHGLDITHYIRQEWKKLCASYLTEARWFYNGHTPVLEEYLENAWISVGGPAAIVHAYILQAGSMTEKSLDYCFKHGVELIYWSSLITRLADDLGTSKAESARGDVAKSTECYMIETGASKEEARDHIKELMAHSWKKLNEESYKNLLPRSMINMCLNMARTAQCIFQHGDGIGTSTGVTKDLLMSLIAEPITAE
ncbi:PREDICTED: probable terpene synthase 9 [Theobroma cacao]|uniref:(+)-delta-cadinene synthase n=1 Tax=Theobroma cacao TaxID=3641 RepID=A0AB32W0J4_THECC|nr:PREDICTED: probable terpene synthase 9 [Theobroma cacao]